MTQQTDSHNVKTVIATQGFSLNEEQKEDIDGRLKSLVKFDKTITMIDLNIHLDEKNKVYTSTIIVDVPGNNVVVKKEDNFLEGSFYEALDSAKNTVSRNREKKIAH